MSIKKQMVNNKERVLDSKGAQKIPTKKFEWFFVFIGMHGQKHWTASAAHNVL